MIVYSATKREFLDDVRSNRISNIIENAVLRKLNRNSPRNEKLSWQNSLHYMSHVLWDEEIPNSAKVAIEYNVPMTNRRVDFILTGKDSNRQDTAVIVELKQWQEVEKTNKDAIVKTRFQYGIKETNHPSYQAWSYSALIHDYNETVRKEDIQLLPCAYMHNLESRSVINDPFYNYHTEQAPVFISSDVQRLTDFFKKFVKYGDSDDIMYRIEHGVIKPSKNLADALASMLIGNQEFLMIDDQKLVYETALELSRQFDMGGKQTLIVQGGPGTGKSVVAINLLVNLIQQQKLVQYVTKNSAPRDVYKLKLKGHKQKGQIDHLFKGSGSYMNTNLNQFDALIIDEAHRLNEKSGFYGNDGDNQIKELIYSSKLSVFFIDEAQRVTLKDIGSVAEIKKWAKQMDSKVTELDLVSQFRCNGSDGYLAWIDNTLQIRPTANETLDDIDFDFRVFDNPNELRAAIENRNRSQNKARLVAGYCWDWKSKKDKQAYDIVISEFDFYAKWNLEEDGGLWLIGEDTVNEIGCIHTSQGLELDYVGVIIGDDLVVRDGQIVTDAGKRSTNDRSIRGYKTLLKTDPEIAKSQAEEIIKNTYRTLMTRGQKGCYIYCTDAQTLAYFKEVSEFGAVDESLTIEPYVGLTYPVVGLEKALPFIKHLPVYDIKAAAGAFSDTQTQQDELMWVEIPDHIRISDDMFVMQVHGESMNRRIPNGSWCLFRFNPSGTRNGKIILVQHHLIDDPDQGGSYTIKIYQSIKSTEDEYINTKILLKPDTSAYGYKNIELSPEDNDELRVIAEFLAVI